MLAFHWWRTGIKQTRVEARNCGGVNRLWAPARVVGGQGTSSYPTAQSLLLLRHSHAHVVNFAFVS